MSNDSSHPVGLSSLDRVCHLPRPHPTFMMAHFAHFDIWPRERNAHTFDVERLIWQPWPYMVHRGMEQEQHEEPSFSFVFHFSPRRLAAGRARTDDLSLLNDILFLVFNLSAFCLHVAGT